MNSYFATTVAPARSMRLLFQEGSLSAQFPVLAFELVQPCSLNQCQFTIARATVSVAVLGEPPPQAVVADAVAPGDFTDRFG